MNWGIFVVQTQPDKYFVFERVMNNPNGKTRCLGQMSLAEIQLRYPLHELLEMPGFFAEMPFMSEPMIAIEVGPKP